MKNYFLYFTIVFVFLFSSCVSKKKFVYLQGAQDFGTVSSNYDPIIQNDDLLSIVVSTLEPDAAVPFNTPSYLVDNEGKIDFPVVGSIQVAGYSIKELKNMLKQKLASQLVDPVINIRILNFKVTVLGDVLQPGMKTFLNHRVTLFDAIGGSGDLTAFGKRYNILIVRDIQGLKTFNRVDITKADFVNSPFYYLDQNDLVYVEQRKAKIDATALPNLPLYVSVLSFLLTVTLLVTK
ncbi:polysaccharide biosynthesis/export family protein [Flavobacterium sp.]|uniref:polysaccharide biosynthesis/export family protein n=1 Tax=Flavobacterium sp. TaxID=239 RepID=UPI002619FD1D|nr:polysaccharide biosynthesis/export family protein [Flavobacterium sp.]